ncbi:armadillo-type protein [Blyttiomyces helicus]|uniref:Armadillo-type protein n=1 Tax=Blyttiomyces helicus TaxID=388810 RepID=A0A4P9WIR7_9FUNG|nr:armadillo-type protein [Blyttiomyces helicus]|eukprot:RKO91793.1 armadillo-type protein [Blyttiomyces helicus]
MAWQPTPETLAGLVQLFAQSNAGNNEAIQTLQSYPVDGEYNCYLATILVTKEVDIGTRHMAGFALNSNVRRSMGNVAPHISAVIKASAMASLADPAREIRNAASSVVSTIVTTNLGDWQDILSELMKLIDSADQCVVEGAFLALDKICEDSAHLLEDTQESFLAYMVPKAITFFSHPNVTVRSRAINCVNQFGRIPSQSLLAHMDKYVEALYAQASDQSPEVRKSVCQAIVAIIEFRPEALLSQFESVVTFMLLCTEGEDEGVALEACEFWLAFAEQEQFKDHLEPFLPRIVPTLLKTMVYSEDELAELDPEAQDDAAVPDKEEDLKPRHHKAARNHASGTSAGAGGEAPGVEDDDDDGYLDDDDDDDPYSKWSLRKCSAAGLDVLATVYGDALLEYLLPLVNVELYHADWIHRECGILALGAVAEGCSTGMTHFLPQIVPHLIQTLRDQNPLVRAITCWTLSRYAGFTVNPAPPLRMTMNDQMLRDHRMTYFAPLLAGLLQMVLDNNKKVQEAGCSALATLEEQACSELVPYLDQILRTLTFAFSKYQRKNLLILYDAVGTLAESVESALNEPQFISLLMPPLITKWNEVQDSDRDIFPLLECMSSVAIALGSGFAQFASEVWQRCLNLISSNLHASEAQKLNPDIDVDKDFMIVALDLLSGIAQALGSSVEPLVGGTSPHVLTLLSVCIKDEVMEVRQSAYALLGDLAISAFGQLKPHLNVFMPELITQIDPQRIDPITTSVCNNATWAAGEIALKSVEAEIQPWIEALLPRLMHLLLNANVATTVSENAAITIGRLGYVCPEVVAPQLGNFIEPWCRYLADIKDNLEKESAFQGLCRMIDRNPEGVLRGFAYFCDAIVKWKRISPDLNENFRRILQGYKTGYGAQWGTFIATLPINTRQELERRYAL